MLVKLCHDLRLNLCVGPGLEETLGEASFEDSFGFLDDCDHELHFLTLLLKLFSFLISLEINGVDFLLKFCFEGILGDKGGLSLL
jgi:hypothetical protein